MKINEGGFGAIETLLVLIIVGIVGFAGWWVYKSKNATNKTLTDTTNSVGEPSKSSKPVTTLAQMSLTSTNYLTIKAWRLRAPVDNGDVLTYRDPSGANIIVDIISKKLADQYDCKTFGAGGISRLAPSDRIEGPDNQTAEQAAKASPEQYKKVGMYYYTFVHDQAACSDKTTTASPAGVAAEQAANNYTKSLISKLEAIPQ